MTIKLIIPCNYHKIKTAWGRKEGKSDAWFYANQGVYTAKEIYIDSPGGRKGVRLGSIGPRSMHSFTGFTCTPEIMDRLCAKWLMARGQLQQCSDDGHPWMTSHELEEILDREE